MFQSAEELYNGDVAKSVEVREVLNFSYLGNNSETSDYDTNESSYSIPRKTKVNEKDY